MKCVICDKNISDNFQIKIDSGSEHVQYLLKVCNMVCFVKYWQLTMFDQRCNVPYHFMVTNEPEKDTM